MFFAKNKYIFLSCIFILIIIIYLKQKNREPAGTDSLFIKINYNYWALSVAWVLLLSSFAFSSLGGLISGGIPAGTSAKSK